MVHRLEEVIFLLLISASVSAEVKMVFDPAAMKRDYFAVPYPNDLHRYPDGMVDRRGFPVPLDSPVSVHYRNLGDGMDGFALTESIRGSRRLESSSTL